MKWSRALSGLLLLVPVAGCTTGVVPIPIGGERDAHGCAGPAGYSWCARTQRCERPWELSKQQGLPENAESFTRFCSQPAP